MHCSDSENPDPVTIIITLSVDQVTTIGKGLECLLRADPHYPGLRELALYFVNEILMQVEHESPREMGDFDLG